MFCKVFIIAWSVVVLHPYTRPMAVLTHLQEVKKMIITKMTETGKENGFLSFEQVRPNQQTFVVSAIR